MRLAAWITFFFKAGIDQLQQNPIGNLLYAAAISQTPHLSKMPSADSNCAELFEVGVPLGMIAWHPGFDDPWLAADYWARQAAEWLYPILDVDNGADRNRTNVPVNDCRRTNKGESMSSILTDHGRKANSKYRTCVALGFKAGN